MLLAPAALLFIPFYLALILLVGMSLVDSTQLLHGVVQPTLANYAAAVLDPYNVQVLVRTLVLSLAVSAICLVLALPLAWGIVRASDPRLRLLIGFVVLLPFMLNALVRLFAWTTILSREGLLNLVLESLGLVARPRSFLRSDFAVLIGQVYFLLPFGVVTLTSALARLPRSVEAAAQTLGAGEWASFFRVTLPLLRPALLAAVIITYSLSVSAFVVPLILGGDQYKMYANLIYDQVTFAGNFGLAAAMALVILVVSVGLIGLYRLAFRSPPTGAVR
jgi:putative spermidine/putrescine transport system permease protein